MNTTSINNLLRALEVQEIDGTPTIAGENKTAVITKFLAKLEDTTANDKVMAHGYFTRALDMSVMSTGKKIITDDDRTAVIEAHVELLISEWESTDQQASAILDMLVRVESTSPETKTIAGEKRNTLKTKLIELL